nr:MAG TPA: Apoptogenic protein 1 [Caudoviricetes sp.]
MSDASSDLNYNPLYTRGDIEVGPPHPVSHEKAS